MSVEQDNLADSADIAQALWAALPADARGGEIIDGIAIFATHTIAEMAKHAAVDEPLADKRWCMVGDLCRAIIFAAAYPGERA